MELRFASSAGTCSCETDAIRSVGGVADAGDRAGQRDRFAGTALVARKGEILLERSWGLANRTRGTAITRSTQFRLGSMNKMFTAVAILQLIEAGKVSLRSPLIECLPDYPNRELAGKVTIRDLLPHTGGTGDIFGDAFDANRTSLQTHADYLKLYGSRPPDFEPGADVARVVRRFSVQTYETRTQKAKLHCRVSNSGGRHR